jgi:hypothetical protein
MKTIAFYISNHGFGHIMRNIPVIACILQGTKNKVVLVTGHKHTELAREYMQKYTNANMQNITFISDNTDFGIAVKAGTLIPDVPKMQEGLRVYIDSFDGRINNALEVFKKYSVDCVVCDIVPWALKAAKIAEIPSVLMASFTWIEIYEELLDEKYIKPFRECFACADKVLLYELANEPTIKRFPQGIKVGFSARAFNEDKIRQIKAELGEKPVVLVSVGGSNSGLKDEIDVSGLPYTFVVTTGVKLVGDNVHYLSVDIDNSQDYVAASDYCIIKAGWTTIAETMLAGKPVALLSRPDVAEDRMIIEMLTREKRAIEITVDELKNISEVIDKIRREVTAIKSYEDSCNEIAGSILDITKG